MACPTASKHKPPRSPIFLSSPSPCGAQTILSWNDTPCLGIWRSNLADSCLECSSGSTIGITKLRAWTLKLCLWNPLCHWFCNSVRCYPLTPKGCLNAPKLLLTSLHKADVVGLPSQTDTSYCQDRATPQPFWKGSLQAPPKRQGSAIHAVLRPRSASCRPQRGPHQSQNLLLNSCHSKGLEICLRKLLFLAASCS